MMQTETPTRPPLVRGSAVPSLANCSSKSASVVVPAGPGTTTSTEMVPGTPRIQDSATFPDSAVSSVSSGVVDTVGAIASGIDKDTNKEEKKDMEQAETVTVDFTYDASISWSDDLDAQEAMLAGVLSSSSADGEASPEAGEEKGIEEVNRTMVKVRDNDTLNGEENIQLEATTMTVSADTLGAVNEGSVNDVSSSNGSVTSSTDIKDDSSKQKEDSSKETSLEESSNQEQVQVKDAGADKPARKPFARDRTTPPALKPPFVHVPSGLCREVDFGGDVYEYVVETEKARTLLDTNPLFTTKTSKTGQYRYSLTSPRIVQYSSPPNTPVAGVDASLDSLDSSLDQDLLKDMKLVDELRAVEERQKTEKGMEGNKDTEKSPVPVPIPVGLNLNLNAGFVVVGDNREVKDNEKEPVCFYSSSNASSVNLSTTSLSSDSSLLSGSSSSTTTSSSTASSSTSMASSSSSTTSLEDQKQVDKDKDTSANTEFIKSPNPTLSSSPIPRTPPSPFSPGLIAALELGLARLAGAVALSALGRKASTASGKSTKSRGKGKSQGNGNGYGKEGGKDGGKEEGRKRTGLVGLGLGLGVLIPSLSSSSSQSTRSVKDKDTSRPRRASRQRHSSPKQVGKREHGAERDRTNLTDLSLSLGLSVASVGISALSSVRKRRVSPAPSFGSISPLSLSSVLSPPSVSLSTVSSRPSLAAVGVSPVSATRALLSPPSASLPTMSSSPTMSSRSLRSSLGLGLGMGLQPSTLTSTSMKQSKHLRDEGSCTANGTRTGTGKRGLPTLLDAVARTLVGSWF